MSETFKFRLSQAVLADLAIIVAALQAKEPFVNRSQVVRLALRRWAAELAASSGSPTTEAPSATTGA